MQIELAIHTVTHQFHAIQQIYGTKTGHKLPQHHSPVLATYMVVYSSH